MQIHELNNFTGTLGSGAYLAIDDGTDTGKISSQGLLAATEARIDNIIAGPAPSAEEIVDARLGADGVTYPSLGDAIRDQVGDLKREFDGANTAINCVKIKNYLNYAVLESVIWGDTQVYTVTGNSITTNVSDGSSVTAASKMLVLGAGTYTVSTQNPCRLQVYADGSKISDVSGATSATFTLTQSSNIYFKFLKTSSQSYPLTIGTIQVELGSTATAFTPYNSPVYKAITQDEIVAFDGTASIDASYITEAIANQGTVQDGVLRYDGEIVATGKRSELSVNAGDCVYFSGYCYNQSFSCVYLLNDSTIKVARFKNQGNYYGNFVVPYGVNKVVVNSDSTPVVAVVTSYDSYYSAKQYIDIATSGAENRLKDKTIVWYGTSIPAGGYIGSAISRNYPTFIANKYGCTMHNEAVGSSCAHCKELNQISEANPYGFNPSFELSSRCLGNTEEEMQWIIDHHDASFWHGAPASISAQTEAEILSFSYENRIDKYLTDETFPDLFVFDHGYNDYISANTDNYTGHEYELYTYQGAMNFFIRRILSYNPEAKIVIIGNYKWQTRNGLVAEAQEAVARRWDIPIFDNWHHTGLSEEQVYCDFEWVKVDGVWTQQSAETHLEKVADILMPDKVHPHSRPDNLLINRMANAIGTWLNDNIPDDN